MNHAHTLIRNVLLFDGTGAPPVTGDLAIVGERIAAMGDLSSWRALRTIDGRDQALSPGFIDAHTHDDRALMGEPGDMLCKMSQGVTTVIVGNCGVSLAPLRLDRRPIAPLDLLGDERWWTHESFGSYARELANQPPAVNVLAFVGHMTLRVAVMGDDVYRSANLEEIATMRGMLAEALAEGAAGFSTGLAYPPSQAAPTEEVIAIAGPLKDHDGLYVTHLRDEGGQVVEAIEEALTIGRVVGCPVVLSHHKCALRENFGRSRITLALIEDAAAHQPVALDAYPYAASSTALLVELLRDDLPVQITWSTPMPDMAGRMLADIATEWRTDLATAARRLQPAGAVYHSMDEGDVRRILAHPRTMIGSDGLPHDQQPHPRLWGTFPRVLGHYARDIGLFTLAEAVHKMTGLTAGVFGLADRGVLRPDAFADLVLFDPSNIRDTASFADPKQPAAGVIETWVNGQSSYVAGTDVTAAAGRLLRRAAGA